MKALFLFLVGFSIISAGIFTDYMMIRNKDRRLKELENSLRLQKLAFQKISNTLKDRKQQLEELEVFDRNLRLVSGLQESGTRIRYIGKNNGVNGEADVPREYAVQAELQRLDVDTKLREISFFQLGAYLQEQKDKLARTPSIAPTSGYISSRYGYRSDPFTGQRKFHAGTDFSTREYSPVYAPADGIVDNTWDDPALGMFLVIDHGYQVVTRYGHLSKYEVSAGRKVKRGDLIARVGNTGRSTAPHLHYEVLINDQYVDPEKFIFWDR